MTSLVTIVGYSDSGKTTLMVKLIHELKKRGLKVGTVKSAHHGYEMDKEGKDSYLHRKAGSDVTVVASKKSFAMVRESQRGLDEIVTYMTDVDIILCEGFKGEKRPKIEIFRQGVHDKPLFLGDENLVAIVTDAVFETDLPVFGLDDALNITDFIVEKFIK